MGAAPATNDALSPRDEADVREAVVAALAANAPLEIVGAGTKRALGRPVVAARRLALDALAGIALYEPDELVLRAGATTPLAAVAQALAAHGQMLAFEPPDLGPLLGAPAGGQTLGGVLACNLAGPRRIKAGAARDHFLGVRAVSGRAEAFKAGGRVVKNVTGYDLCKLMAGSFGTLAVMTEATVKVMPAPEKTRTVLASGLDDARAVAALAAALNSPHEVSAAAHLPAAVAARSGVSYVAGADAAVTAVRVEGFDASVVARCAALRELLAAFGPVEELHRHNSAALWREIADVAAFRPDAPLGRGRVVWRLSVPPASGPVALAAVHAACGGDGYYDWGGGLVWIALDPADDAHEPAVRAAIRDCGGHALLVRAPDAVRAAVPVFEPAAAGVAALSARIKDAFDPARILNPGRMVAGG
ncbi:MAG: FAD-binding protein [Rhodospirillaceae bacterium]